MGGVAGREMAARWVFDERSMKVLLLGCVLLKTSLYHVRSTAR